MPLLAKTFSLIPLLLENARRQASFSRAFRRARIAIPLNHEAASLVVCNAEGPGKIPGSGRFPGEGNGNPLQYSCLENPMDRGAWSLAGYGPWGSKESDTT